MRQVSLRPADLRNLDIIDTRDKLAIYTKAGLLSLREGDSEPRLGSEAGK